MIRYKFESGTFFEPETSPYMNEYEDVVADGPYIAAILRNDFPKFVSLVESERETRNWCGDGSLLYYIIIHCRRLDMFNYLINLDNFDIDSVDLFGRTLLLNIALRTESSLDQFALALLKKGINFHLADNEGNTYLHAAARNTEHLAIAQLVIEKGADVDAQNNDGVTPLNIACESGNVDMIHMLLYCGANATISTNEGLLPVAMYCTYTELKEEEPALLLEILFNHTFDDDDDVTLPVINLAAAMFYNEFYTKISNVTYEISDLAVVCEVIHNCDSTVVEFLFNKFEKVVEDTIKNFPVLDIVTEYEMNTFPSQLLWETLKILLESKHVATLVQNANPAGNIIFKIVKLFNRYDSICVTRVEEREISKMISLMLSYGLSVTSMDLDTVYHHYGYCELFNILLHMDISMVSVRWDDLQMRVTSLYCCNPGINFDDLLAICPPVLLSKYYHHPKLTDIIMKNDYKGIVERTVKMSQVPLLVELSRNVARKYIVDKYSVKNSRQFYTILNWLPVGELNKSILRLEKPLYEGVDYQDDTFLLNSWLK